ncbi:MAG: hypothetical protein ACTFAK_01000 [Candidatus Electronema sp. VV]
MSWVTSINRGEARIEKSDGSLAGTYQAQFFSTIIRILNIQAVIKLGDLIIRTLPNGMDKRSLVTDVKFYQQIFLELPSHYRIKFIREDALKMQRKIQPASFNINNSQVQISNYNTQNIINAIQDLQNKIDSAAATPEEKTQTKGLLSQFLNHPLTVSILGRQLASWLGNS